MDKLSFHVSSDIHLAFFLVVFFLFSLAIPLQEGSCFMCVVICHVFNLYSLKERKSSPNGQNNILKKLAMYCSLYYVYDQIHFYFFFWRIMHSVQKLMHCDLLVVFSPPIKNVLLSILLVFKTQIQLYFCTLIYIV